MSMLGKLKQGDTFAFYVDLATDGVPITGATDKLRCQVRRTDHETLLGELVVSELEENPGRYVFQTAQEGETQSWPTGDAVLDIEYRDGIVSSSDTIKIKIIRDVTRDA